MKLTIPSAILWQICEPPPPAPPPNWPYRMRGGFWVLWRIFATAWLAVWIAGWSNRCKVCYLYSADCPAIILFGFWSNPPNGWMKSALGWIVPCRGKSSRKPRNFLLWRGVYRLSAPLRCWAEVILLPNPKGGPLLRRHRFGPVIPLLQLLRMEALHPL